MVLATIIDVFAATVGLISGVFFSMGVLTVKDSTLQKIAFQMWDKGFVIATELAQQKAQFMAGAVLLAASFLAQMVGKFLPPASATNFLNSKLIEAAIGVGMAIVFGLMTYLGYRLYRAKLVRTLLAKAETKA